MLRLLDTRVPRAMRRFFSGLTQHVPAIESHHPSWSNASADHLRVMTINIAHGRGAGRHQLLLPNQQINKNLDAIAEMLRRERPHIVALQEADSDSSWNGNYSHIQRLARTAGYSYSTSGAHVDAPGLTYGTALLSMQQLADPLSATFATPSISPKGFVIATAMIDDDMPVGIASVHLDFASKRIQGQQLAELADCMDMRPHPVIVLGDFNVDFEREVGLREQIERMGLRLSGQSEATFPTLGKRIDWILVSAEFEVIRYRVIPDRVSDHRAVIADLRMISNPDGEASVTPSAVAHRPSRYPHHAQRNGDFDPARAILHAL